MAASQKPTFRPAERGRVLVVDDETNARTALSELLRDEGYDVDMAADAFKAMGKLAAFAPHVVLTDLRMPGMNGIELIEKVRGKDESCAVVVMTAFGAVDTAVEAMRAGAIEYLTKPLNFDELVLVVERALEQQRLRAQVRQMQERLADRVRHGSIIGSSPQMQRVFDIIEQVGPSRATVLLQGDSGTGKELVAEALHQRSPRAAGPFVKLHCAALAETLLESELFGHERGAFTGAAARRDGRFQTADGGTLFLDEIGEISPSVQVKLLRFLQEHEFERVGGDQTIKVDVRVMAATNKDLEAEVKAGRFREDLFYRLNVVNIMVPQLCEREGDIPLLAQHFLDKYARENDKGVRGFTQEALGRLVAYHWPGNVRELENAVERAVVMARGELIEADNLPQSVVPITTEKGAPPIPGATLEQLEKYAILKTLESTGGSTSKAADILGVSVRKIQYKMHAYNEAPKSNVDVVEGE